mmetsp:Transcript_40138/g.104052  ORF Transcript_40138/g.104052 Transcript_40138/m.104052 type:complete len:88 (+) Transcript_40138:144-407(+)
MIGHLLQHIRATLAFSMLLYEDASVIGSPLSSIFYLLSPLFFATILAFLLPPLFLLALLLSSSSLHLPGMMVMGKWGSMVEGRGSNN